MSRRFARRFDWCSTSSVVGVGLAAIAAASLALGQAAPSVEDLTYPPLGQVEVPQPAQFTLSNGMRVFLLENHELPLISGSALIRTGNLFDPPDKRGLSQVTAEVMRSGGTGTKTGDDIDVELEDIAASVESSMGETSASMSFSGLTETAGEVLGVFKDVLTDPEFRQDKIDLTLNQFRGGIARRNDEASAIPTRELLSILYGRDNSYGWTIEYEHLNNIHREDLIAFYQRYYFPANIMLAVYGDFDTEAMHAQLEALFADWTVEQPAVPAFPEVTAGPAPGIYLAEKADVTQTFFSIGHLGGTLRDQDYPALEVMANILGSGFGSRLFSQIRTRLGYAYNIGATWAANYNHPGTFRITGSTKSASTVETVEAVMAELKKMRTEEVTEQELEEAKDEVLNSFVFFFDSPGKTLSRVMQYDYFGYPEDFLFQYRTAIDKVTRADVLRVAQQYIHPDDLTVVAVGNPAEFSRPLSELGTVNAIDLTIPEPRQELAAADDASLTRGAAILQRAQEAMGGAEALASIQDFTQTLTLTLPPAQGGLAVQQVSRFVAPNHLRQDQRLPFGEVNVYTDGVGGWLSTPQGTADLPPPILDQARGELFRLMVTLMLSDRDDARTVNAVDANTVEISEQGGPSVRVTFDPTTGLPASQTYSAPGATGAPAEVTETFGDWRAAGDFRMPYNIKLKQAGQPAGEGVVASYSFNSGLTAEELSARP